MILFVVSVFFNYKNPVAGHVTVGIAGIFVVLVGIICGFGLAMWCGVQFVAFTGILLFLVLGIGKENVDSREILATSLSVIKFSINKSIEANLFDTVNIQHLSVILLLTETATQRCSLNKRCSENMQQIYRKTPMPKCDFIKVAKQLF